MRFEAPLTAGLPGGRPKHFLGTVPTPGRTETAHCANPGSMLGLAEPGSRIWLSTSSNPSRKLRLSWELVESAGGLVGINTGYANRLAEEALRAGRIEALAG